MTYHPYPGHITSMVSHYKNSMLKAQEICKGQKPGFFNSPPLGSLIPELWDKAVQERYGLQMPVLLPLTKLENKYTKKNNISFKSVIK